MGGLLDPPHVFAVPHQRADQHRGSRQGRDGRGCRLCGARRPRPKVQIRSRCPPRAPACRDRVSCRLCKGFAGVGSDGAPQSWCGQAVCTTAEPGDAVQRRQRQPGGGADTVHGDAPLWEGVCSGGLSGDAAQGGAASWGRPRASDGCVLPRDRAYRPRAQCHGGQHHSYAAGHCRVRARVPPPPGGRPVLPRARARGGRTLGGGQ
mmetsp:Transcript_36068/g.94575  ORF Transcript_36068/g.94575 Transcript_36068/m.94575 type:complete len:206 (-) Transcript_36068:149-766(-)